MGWRRAAPGPPGTDRCPQRWRRAAPGPPGTGRCQRAQAATHPSLCRVGGGARHKPHGTPGRVQRGEEQDAGPAEHPSAVPGQASESGDEPRSRPGLLPAAWRTPPLCRRLAPARTSTCSLSGCKETIRQTFGPDGVIPAKRGQGCPRGRPDPRTGTRGPIATQRGPGRPRGRYDLRRRGRIHGTRTANTRASTNRWVPLPETLQWPWQAPLRPNRCTHTHTHTHKVQVRGPKSANNLRGALAA